MTTDNQRELFDIVNEEDNVIGKAIRGEVHKDKNLIHRSVGVAVFNSKGEMFLQQRSATKDTDPLKWTISCSGHVSAESTKVGMAFLRTSQTRSTSSRRAGLVVLEAVGVLKKQASPQTLSNLDVYHQAAKRELEEELGLKDLSLEFVTKYLCRAPNETEMSVIYKTVWDGKFELNKEEIREGKFFTQKELKEAVESQRIILSFMGRKALEKLGWIPLDKK